MPLGLRCFEAIPQGFRYFNFYTSGASVLQKLYSLVVKNKIYFLYIRVTGKAQHSEPPSLFWKSPLGLYTKEVRTSTNLNKFGKKLI